MPEAPRKPSLEQLLRRHDIWLGHSQSFVKAAVVDSGYEALNRALQHQGWPLKSLVEVCQHYHACEWWLFHPAIRQLVLTKRKGLIALLNPPALPFIAGLQQLGISSENIIVVQSDEAQDFIACFRDLSRSPACPVILAWQPKGKFSYTQLRKLQLCASEYEGLYIIFRPLEARQNSSPASLRLQVTPMTNAVKVQIVKQRGKLQRVEVTLPIPDVWRAQPAYTQLLESTEKQQEKSLAPQPIKAAQVTHLTPYALRYKKRRPSHE